MGGVAWYWRPAVSFIFLALILLTSTPMLSSGAESLETTLGYVELVLLQKACSLNETKILDRISMLTSGLRIGPENYTYRVNGSMFIVYRTLYSRMYVAEISRAVINGSEAWIIGMYALYTQPGLFGSVELKGVTLGKDEVLEAAGKLGWKINEIKEYNITACTTCTSGTVVTVSTITSPSTTTLVTITGYTGTTITRTATMPGSTTATQHRVIGHALRALLISREEGLGIEAIIISNTYSTGGGENNTIIDFRITAGNPSKAEEGKRKAQSLLEALGINETPEWRRKPGALPGPRELASQLAYVLRVELTYLSRIGALRCSKGLEDLKQHLSFNNTNATLVYDGRTTYWLTQHLGVDPLSLTPNPAPYPIDSEHPYVTTTIIHPGTTTTRLTCTTIIDTTPPTITTATQPTTTHGGMQPSTITVVKTTTLTNIKGGLKPLLAALAIALITALAAWIIVRRGIP